MHRLGMFFLVGVMFQLLFTIRVCHSADIVGPDDVLRISVYGYDDLKTETRVSADGRIRFPLVGELVASGQSSIQLEESIAKLLKDGEYIHNPHVSVTVLERVSQTVSVLGYVNKPGRYPLDSNSSLVDMIAMAGGVINASADNKVWVTRAADGNTQKKELDLRDYLENADTTTAFKIQPGDVIYVPKMPVFYIYGEVQHPGGYPLEPDLTVVKALSLGGGLTPRASESGIHIKRKNEHGELHEVEVELGSAVLKDDVIYVNERWF